MCCIEEHLLIVYYGNGHKQISNVSNFPTILVVCLCFFKVTNWSNINFFSLAFHRPPTFIYDLSTLIGLNFLFLFPPLVLSVCIVLKEMTVANCSVCMAENRVCNQIKPKLFGLFQCWVLHSVYYLDKQDGYSLHVVTVLLQDLVLLLLTSGRDPGIIPRNDCPPEMESYGGSMELGPGQTPRLPHTKDVVINGITVKIEYCDTCKLY